MGICRRDFMRCMAGGLASSLVRGAIIRPKLLVLVVLEQLRGDVLDAMSAQFAPNGFRKILSKGAHFTDCRHLASTFSSSALATLATGAWPAQHGIVADSWFDRSAGVAVPASGETLQATTLAAQVAADSRNRAFVIGMNASQTGLFAGTSKARLYWRNPRGQFATLGEPPAWLVQFNNARSIENSYNARWQALEARVGAPPLRTLTYDPDHPQEFLNLYQGSPFGQEAQFDLLSTLIEQ